MRSGDVETGVTKITQPNDGREEYSSATQVLNLLISSSHTRLLLIFISLIFSGILVINLDGK